MLAELAEKVIYHSYIVFTVNFLKISSKAEPRRHRASLRLHKNDAALVRGADTIKPGRFVKTLNVPFRKIYVSMLK
jgi:hypothetical protein